MADLSLAANLFGGASAFIAAFTVVVSIIAAIRSGLIRSFKVGPLEIEGSLTPEILANLKSYQIDGEFAEKPFEVVALSAYYNHALRRANISFWFSLVFAAIGFGVIIFAFTTYERTDVWGTVIKASSGTVIDAVSGLFFIQSTNAQKSMAEFFEKLRLDRLNAEARAIIAEIDSAETRDQLRAQLVLKYAGIDRLLVGDHLTPSG